METSASGGRPVFSTLVGWLVFYNISTFVVYLMPNLILFCFVNNFCTFMFSAASRFKRLINNTSHDKTWTWLRKENFKRETESLIIAKQDSAIRTNHIKARIDKTQQNGKCRLCDHRDETINYVISECSKLEQREYKARHDWVGKVIHWEMCKKFKFDHTNKWYMHNPAPALENDSHKLLWYFNIQTDHLIPARRPDLIIINKKKRTCKIVNFAVPADQKIKLKECAIFEDTQKRTSANGPKNKKTSDYP